MGIYDLLDGAITKKDSRNEAGEPVIHGVMVGVVVENNNKDYPGMVKVEMLVREAKRNISDWMKLVNLYGGSEWGSYVVPEVGDEVLVVFEQGNINRPYVIGSIYKANDKLHKKSFNENNHIKKFKTRGGHEVTFYDEEDKGYIDIKTKKELNIRVDDNKNVIKVTDKDGNNFIQIDVENSKITVEGKNKLLLNSNSSKIHIEGDSNNITAKSAAIKIEGSNSIKLKAQSLDIEAGMVNIKASNVLNMKSDGVANLKGSVVKIN